ncbi:hypothetical protein D3C84_457040 [compost metagenome]
MDFIVDLILSVFFHRIGLWVLRLITLGKFPENNSYLKFLPILVGMVSCAVLVISVLLILEK